MSYSPIDVHELPSEQTGRSNVPYDLTPEEMRILRECAREGIINRGIPLGFLGGLVGLMGARAGLLMNSRFGAKPAVIGLGVIGYFVGRISYSRICFDRALQVPDGSLRKMYQQNKAGREYMDPAEKYYATIEPKHDPGFSDQASNFDIDIPATSSFDTTPSDYYTERKEAPKNVTPESYTSYDDLRKQNREEYSKKMFGDTVRRAYPEDPRLLKRSPPPRPPPADESGAKTKYGDVWDA